MVDENVAQFEKVAAFLRQQGYNAYSTVSQFGAGAKDPEIQRFMSGTNIAIITRDVNDYVGYNVIPLIGGNAVRTAAQVIEAIRGSIGF